MKVVSYDPYNTAEPSGSLSGTSCPPQPHLEVMRTFLMYLEIFPRGDQSMKVACCVPARTFISEIPTKCIKVEVIVFLCPRGLVVIMFVNLKIPYE